LMITTLLLIEDFRRRRFIRAVLFWSNEDHMINNNTDERPMVPLLWPQQRQATTKAPGSWEAPW
jgi:hypothetical protein